MFKVYKNSIYVYSFSICKSVRELNYIDISISISLICIYVNMIVNIDFKVNVNDMSDKNKHNRYQSNIYIMREQNISLLNATFIH
jgi:hypothetical protein